MVNTVSGDITRFLASGQVNKCAEFTKVIYSNQSSNPTDGGDGGVHLACVRQAVVMSGCWRLLYAIYASHVLH